MIHSTGSKTIYVSWTWQQSPLVTVAIKSNLLSSPSSVFPKQHPHSYLKTGKVRENAAGMRKCWWKFIKIVYYLLKPSIIVITHLES